MRFLLGVDLLICRTKFVLKPCHLWNCQLTFCFLERFYWSLSHGGLLVSRGCVSLMVGEFSKPKGSVRHRGQVAVASPVVLSPVPPPHFSWCQWISAFSCGLVCASILFVHWLFSLDVWCFHCCKITHGFGLTHVLSKRILFIPWSSTTGCTIKIFLFGILCRLQIITTSLWPVCHHIWRSWTTFRI